MDSSCGTAPTVFHRGCRLRQERRRHHRGQLLTMQWAEAGKRPPLWAAPEDQLPLRQERRCTTVDSSLDGCWLRRCCGAATLTGADSSSESFYRGGLRLGQGRRGLLPL